MLGCHEHAAVPLDLGDVGEGISGHLLLLVDGADHDLVTISLLHHCLELSDSALLLFDGGLLFSHFAVILL